MSERARRRTRARSCERIRESRRWLHAGNTSKTFQGREPLLTHERCGHAGSQGEQRKEKQIMYIVGNQSESKSAWLQKWGMIMKCADSSLTQKGQVSEHLKIYSITQRITREKGKYFARTSTTRQVGTWKQRRGLPAGIPGT